MPTPLNTTVDIEVKDRERFHLNNLSTSIPYEKFLIAHFQETNAFVAFRSYEYNMTVRTKLSNSSDLARKPLGLLHKTSQY